MKKSAPALLIITAVIALLCAGCSDEEPIWTEIEIPTGTYYYNNDPDSGIYIEVTEDGYLYFGGDMDALKAETVVILKDMLWYATDEAQLLELAEDNLEPYLGWHKYLAMHSNPFDTDNIFVHWVTDEDGNFAGGDGFSYPEENVISDGMLSGKFYLAE